MWVLRTSQGQRVLSDFGAADVVPGMVTHFKSTACFKSYGNGNCRCLATASALRHRTRDPGQYALQEPL